VLAVRLHGASQRASAGAHRHLTGTILTDYYALVPTLLGIGKDAVSALGNLRNGKMLNGKERVLVRSKKFVDEVIQMLRNTSH
jgi:hypothetical protein